MFFDSLYAFIQILLSAILIYIFIVLGVRMTGKRSTSKMNNFDWIVTVAMGSMVGSSILNKDTLIFEGMLGIGALLALQYLSTKLSFHSAKFREVIRASPTLLYYEDHFLRDMLEKERVTEIEVLAEAREAGYGSLKNIVSVILETNGELSFIEKKPYESVNILNVEDIHGLKSQEMRHDIAETKNTQ